MRLTVILSDAAVAAPAGVARFGVQLANALVDQAPSQWSVGGFSHRLAPAAASTLRAQVSGLDSLAQSALARPLLARVWESSLAVAPRGDVVFAPSLFAPIAARQRDPRGTLIVTVHDLVPFSHPETLSAHGARWHRRQIERARRWADAILVPSEAVAEALEHYAPAGDRVHVVPGAATMAPKTSASSPTTVEPYLLFVGTLEPRKGLELLIAAVANPMLADLRLVVAGAQGWGGVDLAQRAQSIGLDPRRLELTGRVDDERLHRLMAGATALVAPSRAEGFGLPVVEAMAVGTPVIHSRVPALCETAGGAGIAVDLDGDERMAAERLAGTIAALVADPDLRARLSTLGLERSAQFSWKASADRLWSLIAR